jgi:hypothetical protein
MRRTQLAAKYRNRGTVSLDAEYLEHAAVAALLQTTTRTLRNWRAKGEGPPFIKHGNTIRYPKSLLHIDNRTRHDYESPAPRGDEE